MQYHADVLERGLQHERPRAPRYLVLGYQSACRDWELRRKRVVAYTTRAAEVYQEPIEEPMVKVERLNHPKAQLSPERTSAGQEQAVSQPQSNGDNSQESVEAKTSIMENPNQSGYNGELESVAQTQMPPPQTAGNFTAISGGQTINGPSLLPSVEILPNLNGNAIGLEANLPPDSLDPSGVPKLDVREQALFEFINNSVANSPMADDSGVDLGMDTSGEAMMGIFGTDSGVASGSGGLDFGMLEAGLRGDQPDAGLKVENGNGPNQGSVVAPSRSPATNPGLNGYDPNAYTMGMGDVSIQDSSNGMMDEPGGNLDLFSQYPAIFNASGNFSDMGFPGSGFPSTNADGTDGGPGGDFDSSNFDYNSVNMDAFFADGMPGMDGMQ